MLRCVSAGLTRVASRQVIMPRNQLMIPSRRQSQYEKIRDAEGDEETAVSNLLYNVGNTSKEPARRHTITALVSNEPGVLSRVTGTMAGRGYNIDSLVVCATEVRQISRATIVLKGQDNVVRQIKRDLEDIVQVWAVVEYGASDSVLERELLLVKVNLLSDTSDFGRRATDGDLTSRMHITRQSLLELTSLFGGKCIDITDETMVVELSAKASRVDAFIKLVKPYGIVESARSGAMAMMRGGFSGFEQEIAEEESDEEDGGVSAEDLPPG